MAPHVTRIAPSPTGDMHIGTARTALFCWLAARASGGRFILRIDDTDATRNTDASVGAIDATMGWLGLDHDLRVRQSDRLPLYAAACSRLLAAGLARRDGAAVRLSPGGSAPRHWDDTLLGRIPVTDRDMAAVDGLVLVRSDGMPTYHLASVADDMDLGVTWVIRGSDHISNTAKHVALWSALSACTPGSPPPPAWSHLGLITSMGRKLSKRDGAASMLAYRDAGVDRDAMCNFLLRLGWGPTVDDRTTRTISRGRAVSLFLDGGRMRVAPSNMDPALLASLDRKYKGAAEAAARPLSP